MEQPKKLVQFLKEKQEPFALDVYLLERGYQIQKRFKNSQHNYISLWYSKNSTKFLKKIKLIPNCSKIAQNLFKGISQVNYRDQKIKNSGNGDQIEAAEDDKFSSASSHTVFNSCSGSDTEERHFASVQDDTSSTAQARQPLNDGMNFVRGDVEDNNQLSPVSVLQETESHDVSSIHKKQKCGKRSQPGSSISISLCKFEKPFDTNAMENQELIDPKFFAHYTKNKRAVLQTKQLLFDCVREVVENETRSNNSGRHFQKILGAEELWKLIYENIWSWSKEPINEAKINKLSHFDLLTCANEWSYLEEKRNEIGVEIGDAIFEDISNEIIVEMMNFV